MSYMQNVYLDSLRFVGLEAAEFENNVAIVVNCYYVGSPTKECCKTGEMNAIV